MCTEQGSSIQDTTSLNLIFSLGNRTTGRLLGKEGGPPAKCKIILCSLLACACDKSKCQTTISTLLTLYLHPTVDIRSRPTMQISTYCLAKCICYYQQQKSIHLFYELVKKGLQIPLSSNINCVVQQITGIANLHYVLYILAGGG